MKIDKIFCCTLLGIQCFTYGLCLYGTKQSLDELSFKEETTICSTTLVENMNPWHPGVISTTSAPHSKPCTRPTHSDTSVSQTEVTLVYTTSLDTDVPQPSTPGEEYQTIVEEPVQNIQNDICETECQYVESQEPTQEQETSSTSYSNLETESPSVDVLESLSDTVQTSTDITNYTYSNWSEYYDGLYNCNGYSVSEENLHGFSEFDILLLRKIVSSEYGGAFVSVRDKAMVVCGVINQLRSGQYGNSILECLNATCTPWGFNPWGNYSIDQSIVDAVEYCFQERMWETYNHCGWSGWGTLGWDWPWYGPWPNDYLLEGEYI